MTTHLEWDRLNDAADGRLAGDAAAEARMHLAACAECRAVVESIRSLGARSRDLPPVLDPPDELWHDVAASIAAGGAPRAAVVHPTSAPPVVHGNAAHGSSAHGSSAHVDAAHVGARHAPPPGRLMPSPRWLAAAAVVLMALSSGVTALVMRRGDAPPASPVAVDSRPSSAVVASGGSAPGFPAAFAATEAAYLQDLAELQATFAAQRPALSPTTIAVVERSLAAIDAAIEEARTALLADPANQALAELLSSTYRHKVELLRRAAESSQST